MYHGLAYKHLSVSLFIPILTILFRSSISQEESSAVYFTVTNLRIISTPYHLTSQYILITSSPGHSQASARQRSHLISHKMCFTELFRSSRHGKRHHKEEREVAIAPRPVRVHHYNNSGHRHSATPARTSYTQVTRTVSRPVSSSRVVYAPSPRQSTSSYRRSGPVVVEQRRSTQYIR